MNYFQISIFYLQLQPVQACSGPVMTCFLHRLIKAFRFHWDLWAKETPGAVSVEGKSFGGGSGGGVVIIKRGSRGVFHKPLSPRWSVKQNYWHAFF